MASGDRTLEPMPEPLRAPEQLLGLLVRSSLERLSPSMSPEAFREVLRPLVEGAALAALDDEQDPEVRGSVDLYRLDPPIELLCLLDTLTPAELYQLGLDEANRSVERFVRNVAPQLGLSAAEARRTAFAARLRKAQGHIRRDLRVAALHVPAARPREPRGARRRPVSARGTTGTRAPPCDDPDLDPPQAEALA